MKQTNTITTGITISNDSTNKKMKFSTQYIKTVIVGLIAVIAFNAEAQIWVNPLTIGTPLSGTYYKGDKVNPGATWFYNFEIGGSSWNASEVGIGKNTDGNTGWNYAGAFYYENGSGSDKRVRRDLAEFQFTSTGTWYVVGRAKSNSGDAWTYTRNTGWANNTTFSTAHASYWTVADLQAPSSVSASATSSTSVQVNFTEWLGRRVVVYRRTTASATPTLTDGTAFGSQNAGNAGTLVYNGFAAANFTDTGLTPGQTYYYSVYSENFSYYSSGVTVSATPCTSPTATISGTSSVCQNGSSQTVTFTGAGGASNYTFTYKINGGVNQTVTSSGNTATVSAPSASVGAFEYTLVSVSDANGCSQVQTGSATVTVNALPNATITASGPTTFCSGQSVGLSVPSAAGATYLWNIGSSTSNSITASSGGQYTCTVTLPTSCSATSSPTNVTVNSNPTITVSASSLETSCGSAVNSTASGAGVGGSYLWSNGGNTATGSFTSAGTYTVTGTTSAGCTGTATVTVTSSSSTTSNAVTVHYYTLPTAVIAGTTSICQNEQNPSITFTGANGTAPYTFTYKINGGSNLTVSTTGTSLSAVVSVPTTTAGTFTYSLVSVTDANCSQNQSGTATVTVNAAPTQLVLPSTSCAGLTGGTILSSTSQLNVTYQLYDADDASIGSVVSGTGNPIMWANIAEGNNYYVIGTLGNCSTTSGNATNVINGANATAYYGDADGDGQASNSPTYFCDGTQPEGYTNIAGADCNDDIATIYTGATELCGNNIDENCSGPSDDMPSFYRTIADGNWGDVLTWETACAAGLTYTPAAYSPPSNYIGLVNIRNNHDVIIPANGATYQTGTLDIDEGGTLTMTGNDFLNTPTSTTTTTNGVTTTTTNVSPVAKLTVTVLIDNAGTMNIGHQASLVQTSTTATNVGSGNINVESKLTGGNNGTAPNGRYWYIGSPMNNTSAGQFFDNQAPVWTRLWRYNATNNSWGVVIQSQTNTNTTLRLIPGIGYLYRAGANKTITYTGTAAANLNNNLTSNLLAPTQDAALLPVTGYNSIGYKFVANPYTSYVDWKLVTRSGLNVSYWIRNAANTAYEAYNATTNVSTSPSGQTTQFIPPMQGFWVYAFTATPSLRIDNTDRVHSNNVLHAPLISQVVRLKLNDGKSSDYAVVYENELASNDFEETDTDKMFDYDFHQLYTMEGEHELALNGLLNATAKGSVEMGMVVPNNGPYTIEATDLGFEEDVILEDKFNKTFQDMKVNPIYSFTSNAGTFNNRFVLHFTATESVAVGETVGETEGVKVFNTSNQQVKVWVSNTTAEYQGATVKVYDAIGNMIERKNMTSNELYLDLDIASGIYVVEVTGDSKVFTKKIFITK